jgi:dGTPase
VRRAGIGPFRHNLQAIQALERVEKAGLGLNLTLQVLDGILCHNGEMNEQAALRIKVKALMTLTGRWGQR